MGYGTGPAHRIAVVGSGPRGLGVIERAAARLADGRRGRPVEFFLIDAVEVGCGRVWRSDQPDWFLMNTVCGEVSMFSGPPDGGADRPGAGPSLAQWWARVDPACPGPHGYAPRGLHGRYMRFALDAFEAALPPHARLHRVTALVEDVERDGGEFRLTLADGRVLTADRVVLTTGHPVPRLTGENLELARFAAERPGLRYIRGDSAADLPLADLPAGSPVGILGIGLSFYDVMYALTVGRGGEFTEAADGSVAYRPSGREPLLVAGSRSGVPLPARGRSQKSAANDAFQPKLFTPARVRAAHGGGAPLDFNRHVLPWIQAEIDLVYNLTGLRNDRGPEAAARFVAEVESAAAHGLPDVAAIAARHGAPAPHGLDLEALSRPYARRDFPDPAAFERELAELMRRDLEHAERGNADDPLKAALDVLRDTRWAVRELVDFGGLDPESHRGAFLRDFAPRSSFLAAGPPRIRVRYALALIDAGLLRLVGPEARFAADAPSGRFIFGSPRVAGSEIALDTVIDARIPEPNLHRDPSVLAKRLRERGTLTEFVNGEGETAFHTGGVAVTPSPFHPIGRDGVPDTAMYVLGVPTEFTRWFTLVGSGRPGPWNEFVRDADAIAAHALSVPADEARPPGDPVTAGDLVTAGRDH